MDLHDETQLRWIEGREISQAFHRAPFPPRADRGPLGPLVRSIRDLGCICPLLARPRGLKLEVVCGYRRLLAAQAAGLASLPVLVRELSDDECWRLFADENCRREPLSRRGPFTAPLLPMGEEAGPVPPAVAAPGEAAREPAPLPAGPVAAVGAATQAPLEACLPPTEKEAVPDLLMATLSRRAEVCFRGIAETRSIPVEDVEGIAVDLITMAPLRQGKDLRAFAVPGSRDWLLPHSLAVAALGIHLAEALGWTSGQTKKFALACLLHDIGMLFIPRQCLLTPGPLTASQRALVERHPEIGREIIQASRAWGAQIHLVAQDHHERWDGSGYPGQKKGKEVDLPARIVGFLDCFAALVAERPHRPAMLYSQASRFMVAATEVGLHDPEVLAHFRKVFTDLPVGSCLRLPDGRIGRVVGFDPFNPRRHRVRILDESGALAEGVPIWIGPDGCPPTEIAPPGAGAGATDRLEVGRTAVLEALKAGSGNPALEPSGLG